MNFDDSTEEAALRAEAREWLARYAPPHALPADRNLSEEEEVAAGRAWLKTKAEGGFAGITLPKEIGGRGGSMIEAVIFNEEESTYRVPRGAYINIGLNMALPALLAHGTQEQIERFAAATLRGEIVWCQLFSEPAAGSDLAALRCKAVKSGEDWVVSGQKVWSSWARHANWGILLARTDSEVAKHKGLTFFVLDMNTPGIEVRPIRQISGASDFCETFITEARIPDSCRIGSVGGGWGCAMTVLTGERLSQGGAGKSIGVASLLHRTLHLQPRSLTRPNQSNARYELACAYAEEQAERHLQARLRTMVFRGENPGALPSIIKLAYANRLQKMSARAMEWSGSAGLAATQGDTQIEAIWDDYIWSVAMRIAGGADEVLRNQLAERALGMPGEPRNDKNIPFSQLLNI